MKHPLTVSVEFSYPTSPNATRFGFYNTGCWTVETHQGDNPPVSRSGHRERAEAMHAARQTGLAWWPIMLLCHPELTDSPAQATAAA